MDRSTVAVVRDGKGWEHVRTKVPGQEWGEGGLEVYERDGSM